MYLFSWPSLSCVNALGRIIRKCSWSVLLSRSQILKKFSKLRTSLKWNIWEFVISLRKFVYETESKIMGDNCAYKNGENFTQYILRRHFISIGRPLISLINRCRCVLIFVLQLAVCLHFALFTFLEQELSLFTFPEGNDIYKSTIR